jgi:drug/metabolite transporter (DMT)-like permease
METTLFLVMAIFAGEPLGPLPGIFSLLVGVAGWYYLFYSRAAEKLGGIERAEVNRTRLRLRRIGGFVMLLLAIATYAGFYTFDPKHAPAAFVATWIAVFILLFLVVLLALLDVRLTAQLRRKRPTPPNTP